MNHAVLFRQAIYFYGLTTTTKSNEHVDPMQNGTSNLGNRKKHAYISKPIKMSEKHLWKQGYDL